MTGQGDRAQPADRGSASIWLLGLVALVLAVTLTVLIQSAAILGRHRLQRSADLTALAAAGQIGLGSDPCQAARRIATANRAVLERCVADLDPGGRSGTVAVWLSGRIGLPLLGPRSLHGRARAGRLPGPGQQPPVPWQRCRGRPADEVKQPTGIGARLVLAGSIWWWHSLATSVLTTSSCRRVGCGSSCSARHSARRMPRSSWLGQRMSAGGVPDELASEKLRELVRGVTRRDAAAMHAELFSQRTPA